MTTTEEPQLTSGDFWGADPHTALTWLRANDPVYWDPHGGVWGLTRYADVKYASLHPELFSSAGGIRPETPATPMMIDKDDPQHLLRRKLISKGFTPRRVADLRPRIDEITHGLLDRICERGECEFVSAVAAWLPLIVIGDQLGVRPDHYDDLLRWSDDMMAVQGQRADPVRTARMATAMAESREYFTGVLADRRATPTDDLIGTLVHAEVDGERLDDNALYFDSLLLLIGGDETTRHVISGGLYQLLAERDRWERLRADRSLLPSAIEEMLRWVTPIRNMARTVTRDLTLHGRELREGQKLLLLYPSANRDEDVFTDPFRFDLTRSPNNHLAFGIGTHFCLGASLARLELEAVFTALLDRFPDLHLTGAAEPPLRPAMFVSGYEELPVAFTPTAPRTARP
ncbi:cytochrome P450 [Cryptosporangium aurantiacum]|uniref:Cytochrome P450, family 142, subfamily A, polypeptide 1 n=1 Tax=Cryptosporangium aurantiacum TaxID=134849 RepID=A0A1M7RK01_9ACTN|nr:cytochrome P450 [Cryptosporangium aurantiacum]SHN46489.1 cytochrome P450, family 142, subfamily A, polypeptide 1 [Cryptosporangium aurantiacum]